MATPSTTETRARLKGLIEAAHEHLDQNKPVVLNGVRYTRAKIVAALEAHLAAQALVDSCEGALRQARADRARAAKDSDVVSRGLEAYLRITLGPSSPFLENYGVAPRKTRKVSVETKKEAAEKGRKTREAKKAALQAVARKARSGG
jgi:hypothetical protein